VQGFLDTFDSEERAKQVAAELQKHGLAMRAAYAGGRMHEEEPAAKAIEAIARRAGIGKKIGLEVVVHNPDSIGREKTDAELEVQAKSLNRLGGALREIGLRLAIHTHDPEMRSGAREWYHMLRHTDADKVFFCLDLHWIYRGKQDPIALLKAAGSRVLDLHLRNSKEGVWTEDLGPGDLDYRDVARTLQAISYQGFYTVELAYEGKTAVTRGLEENLRRSRAFVKEVLGK
jgi:inosose dehydratase